MVATDEPGLVGAFDEEGDLAADILAEVGAMVDAFVEPGDVSVAVDRDDFVTFGEDVKLGCFVDSGL